MKTCSKCGRTEANDLSKWCTQCYTMFPKTPQMDAAEEAWKESLKKEWAKKPSECTPEELLKLTEYADKFLPLIPKYSVIQDAFRTFHLMAEQNPKLLRDRNWRKSVGQTLDQLVQLAHDLNVAWNDMALAPTGGMQLQFDFTNIYNHTKAFSNHYRAYVDGKDRSGMKKADAESEEIAKAFESFSGHLDDLMAAIHGSASRTTPGAGSAPSWPVVS